MLTPNQQRQVWEAWLGAEIRALYFAELAQRYQQVWRALLWASLLTASGAAAAMLAQGGPVLPSALALVTAALNTTQLAWDPATRAMMSADLHRRWHRLATAHEALWDTMYAAEAPAQLHQLAEQEAELSAASTTFPNRVHRMAHWQKYVEEQHASHQAA